jgi:hypothetical protein
MQYLGLAAEELGTSDKEGDKLASTNAIKVFSEFLLLN